MRRGVTSSNTAPWESWGPKTWSNSNSLVDSCGPDTVCFLSITETVSCEGDKQVRHVARLLAGKGVTTVVAGVLTECGDLVHDVQAEV